MKTRIRAFWKRVTNIGVTDAISSAYHKYLSIFWAVHFPKPGKNGGQKAAISIVINSSLNFAVSIVRQTCEPLTFSVFQSTRAKPDWVLPVSG